jgi:hypothetical protein
MDRRASLEFIGDSVVRPSGYTNDGAPHRRIASTGTASPRLDISRRGARRFDLFTRPRCDALFFSSREALPGRWFATW